MSVTSETLTVIIPVYNERDIIEHVLRDWYLVLTSMGITFVLKCYNDGSKDDTLKVMTETSRSLGSIQIYDNSNAGHGPTIIQGYTDSCTSTWIFQVDSDNEISAVEFTKLWQKREKYDLILGIRRRDQLPLTRKIISFFSRKILAIFYGSKAKDVNTPFRLMRVQAFEEYFELIPPNTFAPNILITGGAALKGLRCLEVPVQYQARQTGMVSIRKFNLLKVSLRALVETLVFRFIRYR